MYEIIGLFPGEYLVAATRSDRKAGEWATQTLLSGTLTGAQAGGRNETFFTVVLFAPDERYWELSNRRAVAVRPTRMEDSSSVTCRLAAISSAWSPAPSGDRI